MRLKKIDGELYVDTEVKVFFNDQEIPDEFKDKSKYTIVIVKRASQKTKN